MTSRGRKRKANVSLLDAIAETLDCPVCLKTIKDPPVFLCEEGHELCNPCRQQLKDEGKACPVCRSKLTETRARAVEKMLEKLPRTKCKRDGCDFARNDAQLVKDHEEKECKLRPVECGRCKQPVALSQLHRHLVTGHKLKPTPFEGLEVEVALKTSLAITDSGIKDTHWPLAKTDNGLEFFTYWKSYNKSLVMFWVSLAGTPKEAEGYEFSIKIRSGIESDNTTKDLLTGGRECNSCDLTHEDVMESGSALFLNRALLEKAAGNGHDRNKLVIYWTLIIKKK